MTKDWIASKIRDIGILKNLKDIETKRHLIISIKMLLGNFQVYKYM